MKNLNITPNYICISSPLIPRAVGNNGLKVVQNATPLLAWTRFWPLEYAVTCTLPVTIITESCIAFGRHYRFNKFTGNTLEKIQRKNHSKILTVHDKRLVRLSKTKSPDITVILFTQRQIQANTLTLHTINNRTNHLFQMMPQHWFSHTTLSVSS